MAISHQAFGVPNGGRGATTCKVHWGRLGVTYRWEPQQPHEDPVAEALGRVLASPGFAHNERLSNFLRYVVQQKLHGKADEIKETVIGAEVFRRRPDYDPRGDPIVRMEAAKLRARLAEYYNGPGAADRSALKFPKGLRPSVAHREEAARALVAEARRDDCALRLPGRNSSSGVAVVPFRRKAHHRCSSIRQLQPGSRGRIFRRWVDRGNHAGSLGRRGSGGDVTDVRVRPTRPTSRCTRNWRQARCHCLVGGKRTKVWRPPQSHRSIDPRRRWQTLVVQYYDRELRDVFAIQEQIADSIANALRLKFGAGRERYTQNLEAYQFYLRGRYSLDGCKPRPRTAVFRTGHCDRCQHALAYGALPTRCWR